MLQLVLMIVCVCRRLNEKKIADAINAGAKSATCVMSHHATKFNCGQCRHEIGDMIDKHVNSNPSLKRIAAE
jgi:bacterioferritin-associated ferredoxin